MDFGRPNVEIGWKMANSQLLFLALKFTWISSASQPASLPQDPLVLGVHMSTEIPCNTKCNRHLHV